MANAKVVKPVQVKLIVGAAELKKEAGLIMESGAKFAKRVQLFLMSAAVHGHEHSDCETLVEFLNGEVRGSRMNAMREWAIRYAPVGLNTEGKFCFSRPYENKDDAARAAAIKAVMGSPDWDTLKKEPAFVPFVLETKLTKFIAEAEKALKDEEHKGEHKVDVASVAELKRLLQTLQA